ncbi:cytochrome b [Siculibacillus lacustris]|uniref:Cytochrome b n=1 Tax=Siculibacillus lacustris TaxID=1549641 RepID=A0A4Q9VSL3_9HYPH|nr:cytochrome b/b6 domain-containing protein [Siculibacillus lacustris]TBW38982.1 cytochrome b [Siculibacillus lacustris]
MSVSDAPQDTPTVPDRYGRAARWLHWVIAVFVACLIPLGLAMVARGAATNFDGLTDRLYSAHKLLGFVVLWLMILRVVVRLRRGAPPPLATLTPLERVASQVVHVVLYVLLLVVPLLGWAGVSAFPALNVFGLFDLPAILPADQAIAAVILGAHKLLALGLGLVALAHVAAALRHRFLKRDGVMRRMWPPD